MKLITALFIICIIWISTLRPFIGELYHFQYLKTGEEHHLIGALDHDPLNSRYLMSAIQFYGQQKKYLLADEYVNFLVDSHNGDLVTWVIYFTKGLINYGMNNIPKASYDFVQSLYYNPNFKPAQNILNELNKK